MISDFAWCGAGALAGGLIAKWNPALSNNSIHRAFVPITVYPVSAYHWRKMDIVAHALWTTAAGLIGKNKVRRPLRIGRLAAWGIMPDVIVFAIPAAIRIGRYLSGLSKTLLPDGTGPRFDWVWNLYNGTHSLVIFAVCFAVVWILRREPLLEMLGWPLHIVIDIFTHTGIFAIKFLWPLSSVCFSGTRWENPRNLAINYAALACIYLYLWRRQFLSRSTQRDVILSEGRASRVRSRRTPTV